MQAIRREHPTTHLLAHQREDVDVGRAGAFGLLAGDRVEAVYLRGDRHHVAERRAGSRQRPVRLRQRVDRRCFRIIAHAPVDEA